MHACTHVGDHTLAIGRQELYHETKVHPEVFSRPELVPVCLSGLRHRAKVVLPYLSTRERRDKRVEEQGSDAGILLEARNTSTDSCHPLPLEDTERRAKGMSWTASDRDTVSVINRSIGDFWHHCYHYCCRQTTTTRRRHPKNHLQDTEYTMCSAIFFRLPPGNRQQMDATNTRYSVHAFDRHA